MRILLVEDDKDLCDGVALQLRERDYQVDCCHSGETALYYALHTTYEIIILDRMLPVIDGLSVLETIRRQGVSTPVLMVTAMSGIHDRVDGLDAGADDYLVKPFAMEELFARIRALTRRPAQIEDNDTLRFSDLVLDVNEQELSIYDNLYTLSKKESELMAYFIKHPGKTLARESILSHVWGPDTDVESGNLDNYVYFLRRRLKLSKSRVSIKTIYGTGYRMEVAGEC